MVTFDASEESTSTVPPIAESDEMASTSVAVEQSAVATAPQSRIRILEVFTSVFAVT